jgi:hypothetical protein
MCIWDSVPPVDLGIQVGDLEKCGAEVSWRTGKGMQFARNYMQQ